MFNQGFTIKVWVVDAYVSHAGNERFRLQLKGFGFDNRRYLEKALQHLFGYDNRHTTRYWYHEEGNEVWVSYDLASLEKLLRDIVAKVVEVYNTERKMSEKQSLDSASLRNAAKGLAAAFDARKQNGYIVEDTRPYNT